MIIIKSDYSPSHAPELQEVDNVKMLYTALHLAGLGVKTLKEYKWNSLEEIKHFRKALGEPLAGTSVHTDEQWKAAMDASESYRKASNNILVNAGVTIVNKLIVSEDEGYYSHIETTVYTGSEKLKAECRIERPVVDITTKYYKTNAVGCCADQFMEIPHELH